MNKNEIRITVDDHGAIDESTPALQARSSFEDAVRRAIGSTVSVKLDVITEQLADTYLKLTAAIEALPKTSHGCKLQTVTFTLAFSSSGEVSLLSTVKGKVDGNTGLTFTICREE